MFIYKHQIRAFSYLMTQNRYKNKHIELLFGAFCQVGIKNQVGIKKTSYIFVARFCKFYYFENAYSAGV